MPNAEADASESAGEAARVALLVSLTREADRSIYPFFFFAGAFFFSPATLDTSSSAPRACILFFFFFVGVSPVVALLLVPALPGPPKGELTARATVRRDD